MGAWGAGPFDNDGAMDWFIAYQDDGVSALHEVFAEFQGLATDDYVEVDIGSGAVAAAEVVAACHGKPLSGVAAFPMGANAETLQSDLIAHKAAVLQAGDLVAPCLAVLDRVVHAETSELAELWAEAAPHDNAAFLASVADLKSRLEAV
ncbi:DUF4259 domain-containing protein [Yoonia sp. BS5-3]|uniref:DUF4259 domain-containing protein n=1 Tax=Yoonia phaeophyticola TaxID=3137369 RepID=A0ABZ2V267_9RHOB